ncbi:MAG: DNA replication/repair protein RecF [Clostridia bacterium]|nr:DNA replication/repair protein RecF [Clostridia bacterium]
MKIKSLTVKNFRNLAPQKIEFSDGLNVLFGKNAQGKTNTIEAIYCSTIGRSPKTRRDGEMIAFNHGGLEVLLNYEHKQIERVIKLEISHSQKSVFVDDTKLKKLSDVIGNFGSVYFSPEELSLTKNGPGFRRRFMDIINCQLSKNYLSNLQRFQKLLNQRNALLKQPNLTYAEIEVWDRQLIAVGAKIFDERKKFCEKLSCVASTVHKKLTNENEQLEIVYQSELNSENTAEEYLNSLAKNFDKERILGYTTFGLQNDDFLIKLNKRDLKKVGSQGQHRTVTLSLKLAELEILKEEYGEYPVLLLDDVLSELDQTRRQKLCEYIMKVQCILTCTEFDLPLSCQKYLVDGGVVTKIE